MMTLSSTYSLGVLTFGVYLYVQHRRGRVSTSANTPSRCVDTTYLTIAGLALAWPIYALAWFAFKIVGRALPFYPSLR